MQAPTYTPPPPDPLVVQAEQTAQNQLVAGLQTQARGDTASLMAQYGALATARAGTPSTFSGINGTPPAPVYGNFANGR